MIDYLIQHGAALLQATFITLQLLLIGVLGGFFLAIILVIFMRGPLIFRLVAGIWISFIRGTPLIIQLFLIYFGISQFEFVRNSFLWSLLSQPYICASLALVFNSSAYTAVLLDGALRHLPAGETEVARALAMPPRGIFLQIRLKRALLNIKEAYGNEIIMVLKATALVGFITLLDLMALTRQIYAVNFDPLLGLFIAAIIYGFLAFLMLTLWHKVVIRKL